MTQRRHLSDTPIAQTTPDYLPVSIAQGFLESVHHYSHLPWWCTIVLTCVGLRCVITLPLAVYQNKLITSIELLQPTLKELTEALKHRVTIEGRNKGLSSQAANKIFKKQVWLHRNFFRFQFFRFDSWWRVLKLQNFFLNFSWLGHEIYIIFA